MKRNKRVVLTRLTWVILAFAFALVLAACSPAASPAGTPLVTAAPQPTNPPRTTVAPLSSATAASQPTVQAPAASPTKPTLATTVNAQALPPTPVCGPNLKITPAQTEGPYYKPDTPARSSLAGSDMTGTKLIVTGYVLSADCKPVAGAWLDFWQANDAGEYDNAGYTLRGHQTTDASGRYYLETVVPGLYPGRTRHIHVKVQAPNGPILTTQLYFPNEPGNSSDSIFDPALIVNVQDTTAGRLATFNFVLNTH